MGTARGNWTSQTKQLRSRSFGEGSRSVLVIGHYWAAVWRSPKGLLLPWPVNWGNHGVWSNSRNLKTLAIASNSVPPVQDIAVELEHRLGVRRVSFFPSIWAVQGPRYSTVVLSLSPISNLILLPFAGMLRLSSRLNPSSLLVRIPRILCVVIFHMILCSDIFLHRLQSCQSHALQASTPAYRSKHLHQVTQ